MYEDLIAALMDDMQVDSTGARARALRDQPPPPPPPPGPPPGMGPPGGATGSWGPPEMPPPPAPMPLQDAAQQPAGPPPAAVPPPQAPQPPPRPPQAPGGPPRALPQALGQGAPPAPEAPDPYQANAADLGQQHERATASLQAALQTPDMAQAQEAYQRRAQEQPRLLLHALAAERVGKKNLAKHYYGAAAEVDQPLKTPAGTMTAQGFIPDPTHAQALKVRSAEARVQAIERAEQANLTAAERRRLEKERQKAAADLQRERQEYQRGTAVLVKSMSAKAGGGGDGGLGGPSTQVGVDEATKSPVFRHTKSGRLFRYGPDGSPIPHEQGFAPKSSTVGHPSEDENKTLGFLTQATQAYGEMRRALKADPKAAEMSFHERATGILPKQWGRDVAFANMTPTRQIYTTAVDKFADAVLKVATGAGQSEEEARRKIDELTPRYGESDESVAAKERGMQAYLQALKLRAGRAYKQAESTGNAPSMPADTGSGALSPQESEELLLLRQRFKVRGN